MRLAMMYSSIAGVGEAAQFSYRFALEHRDDLSPRDQVLLGTIEPLFAAPPDWTRYHRILVEAAHTHPGDAEFHFLACASAQRIGLMAEALPHARRAAELDPSYGDAWQSIGNILAALGRSDEAYEMLGVCIEKVPTSLDCLADRVLLASLRGQCEQAFRDAQLGIKRGGDGYWYERVAQLAAASGRPYEAVVEAMRQASTRYPRAEAAFRPLQNQFELDVYRGDLEKARARSETLVAEAAKRDELHLRVVNQVRRALILEELGEGRRAAEEAKGLVAASDALSSNARNTIGYDRMPVLYRVMHAGDAIDDAEFARLRAEWLGHWSERHGAAADLWLHGQLEMVASADDAKAAVAARPADFGVERVYRSDFHRGAIGRAYLMAGEADEALLHLRAAISSCAVLSRPIRYVQDHLLLGRALEAKGDSDDACKAYGYVVERWGKTISVSAAEAKKRIAALGCK
jgi:tetratricopeptide (TPR) repeat protein